MLASWVRASPEPLLAPRVLTLTWVRTAPALADEFSARVVLARGRRVRVGPHAAVVQESAARAGHLRSQQVAVPLPGTVWIALLTLTTCGERSPAVARDAGLDVDLVAAAGSLRQVAA